MPPQPGDIVAKARRLHARGIEERDRVDWSGALALFQQVLKLEEAIPDDQRKWGDYGKTLHEIASLELRLGHVEAARAGFEAARTAKEKEPPERQDWNDYSITLHELAFVQRGLDHCDDALRTLRDNMSANRHIADAGIRNSADASALNLMARVHVDREQWADAADAFAASFACAERAAPEHRPSLPTDTHYWLAYVLVELERWDDALVAARDGRAVLERMAPTERDRSLYFDIMRELAHIHARRHERSEAARVLRVARLSRGPQ